MNLPCANLDAWCWDLDNFTLADQQVVNNDEAYLLSYNLAIDDTYPTDTLRSNRLEFQGYQLFNGSGSDFNTPNSYEYQQATWTPRPDTESFLCETRLPEFDSLLPRSDPPYMPGLQKQTPRFEGDLYTAPFIKGEGVERAGWCGFCCSWHKLKDSAFWYVSSRCSCSLHHICLR